MSSSRVLGHPVVATALFTHDLSLADTGSGRRAFPRFPFQIVEHLMQTVDGVTRALNVYEMKTQNKPVDATARSSLVRATSTAPPHHL